jgi:hypothetical protein
VDYSSEMTASLLVPSPDHGVAFLDISQAMRIDGETDSAIAAWITGAIHDGLTKDNWPVRGV